ncbi:MAG TPA: EI24 domain-containing protein [Bacteroidia bacterium]
MKFFSGFGKGFTSFFKAFGFVFEKGLWHFLFYPLILWIILLLVGIYLTDSLGDYIQTLIDEQLATIPEEGHWLSWLKNFENGWFGFIVAWILKIFLWFISGTFMKYITLILLSPVFSLLSEAAAVKLGGKAPNFDMGQLMKDILRGTMISLRNMFFEYTLMFICFVLCMVFPPLAIIATPFMFFAGWYFIGFSMLDYSCERNRMGVIESIRFIRSNMGLACGLGFCYSIIMWLPLLGMIFSPIMAVTGATLAFEEFKQKQSNVQKAI